jgi:flagellar biosynthesis/type III secretory pathway M-ring protein FliF/YscJ
MDADDEAEEDEPAALPQVEPRLVLPSNRERVETMIAERPEVAARLIRTWLQENNA